jgi:serralysin
MALALVVASGVAWAASISCPNRSGNLCVGTDNKDTMTGMDDRADDMRGKGRGDEMKGRGGGDTVLGQDGPDTLSGGPGKDTLGGGPGKDTLTGAEGPDALEGGSDDDTYKFGINDWGNDTITDTITPDDGNPDTGDFAQFGSTERFLNTELTIDLTSSASSPEVKNGALTGTVNWSNDVIEGVYVGSTTDDTINGNTAANTKVSNIGASSDDTIDSEAGKDWISVLDGSGGDKVDCGEGAEDTVYFDAGDTGPNPQTQPQPINCERLNPP